MRNLKKEIDHDGLFKRMDARLDGRRNVDLDIGRRTGGYLAGVVINNQNKE
jgi:hypothetical protein